jgi:hypothetical protein
MSSSKSVIKQIYIAICVFIENNLKKEACNQFVKALVSGKVDLEGIEAKGDNAILASLATYFNGGILLDDNDHKFIENLIEEAYCADFYRRKVNDLSLTLADRQQAKDNCVKRSVKVEVFKLCLIDSTQMESVKESYNAFLKAFYFYRAYTHLIANDTSLDCMKDVLQERRKESDKIVGVYGTMFDLCDNDLRSVLEDDLVNSKRINKPVEGYEELLPYVA